jgi:phosphoglycolate phosphatase-like HAD superfamily hydrolase
MPTDILFDLDGTLIDSSPGIHSRDETEPPDAVLRHFAELPGFVAALSRRARATTGRP